MSTSASAEASALITAILDAVVGGYDDSVYETESVAPAEPTYEPAYEPEPTPQPTPVDSAQDGPGSPNAPGYVAPDAGSPSPDPFAGPATYAFSPDATGPIVDAAPAAAPFGSAPVEGAAWGPPAGTALGSAADWGLDPAMSSGPFNTAGLPEALANPSAAGVPALVTYQNMLDNLAPADRGMVDFVNTLGTPGDSYGARLAEARTAFMGLSPEVRAELAPRINEYVNTMYTPALHEARQRESDAFVASMGASVARMPGDFLAGAFLGSAAPEPGLVSGLGHAASYMVAPYAAGARDLATSAYHLSEGRPGQAALDLLGPAALAAGPVIRTATAAMAAREIDSMVVTGFPAAGVVDVVSTIKGQQVVLEAGAARDYASMLRRLDDNLYPAVTRDGAEVSFRNGIRPAERPLPGGADTGYYREFGVPGPVAPGMSAGPERLVTGRFGEVFYTPDHYRSFIQLRGIDGVR